MHRLFHLNPEIPEERNAWYLVVEIFWASMLASAATFNAAFALRLGASNTQVSLLSSIPALMAVIVSIPSGNFLNKRKNRKSWLLISLTLYRASFLIVALIPLLKLPADIVGLTVIITIVLFSSLAHFFNVGFIPLLSDVISERNRASVFSARNIIYNLSLSVCGFLFGLWLERVSFPINYQLLYIFGFLCSLLSVYYLIKVEEPPNTLPATLVSSDNSIHKTKLKESISELSLRYPGFIRITLNTLLHGLGVWAAAPLYILHFVRNLNASEAWIGLYSTIATAATILGFILWRKLLVRWGETSTLKRTIMWVGFYPLLVGLIWFIPSLRSLTPILLLTAINGLIIPGVNLSHFNTLLKVTPEHNRPGYTAAYITLANIGAFVCPFIGVFIANHFGLAITLAGCGLACIIGSCSFWLFPIQTPK